MTNIPSKLRTALAERYYIGLPEAILVQESKQDGTRKCLFEFRDGARVESVFMKYNYGILYALALKLVAAWDVRSVLRRVMVLKGPLLAVRC